MRSFLSTVHTVFRHEMALYFCVPIGYLFIAIFVFLANFLTFTSGAFFEVSKASLAYSFFKWHPLLFAFLAPAIGMRIWTAEKQQGTLELLFAQPIRIFPVVMGKYLAAYVLLLAGLGGTFLAVATIEYLGEPDYGEVLSGYLGSALIAASFLAISSYFSAYFKSPVTAYIISATVCIGAVLLGTSQVENELLNIFPNHKNLVDVISSLSVMTYYAGFRKGLIEFQSFVYFLLIITMSLGACVYVLHKVRS